MSLQADPAEGRKDAMKLGFILYLQITQLDCVESVSDIALVIRSLLD